MITLTAKINLFDVDKDAVVYSVSSNSYENNISSRFDNVIETSQRTKSPFLIGSSSLGTKYTFENRADYFISKQLSDDTGLFTPTQTIYIQTNYNVKSLVFSFDTANNEHPLHVKVDGLEYIVSQSEFAVGDLQETGYHTLEILDWNSPKKPLVISGIYTNIVIDIDRRKLISMNIPLSSKPDNSTPSYGIISSNGNISFNDTDGMVKNYAEQNLLVGGLTFEASINNTLKKVSQTIGVFETSEWNYDAFNRSVSVTLKDGLEEWQEIHVDAISFNPTDTPAWTGEDVYVYFYDQTPSKYKMLSFSSLDEETKNILKNTIIPFKFLTSGSLWNQWQKLCTVCMAYIYKKPNGQTTFSYRQGA